MTRSNKPAILLKTCVAAILFGSLLSNVSFHYSNQYIFADFSDEEHIVSEDSRVSEIEGNLEGNIIITPLVKEEGTVEESTHFNNQTDRQQESLRDGRDNSNAAKNRHEILKSYTCGDAKFVGVITPEVTALFEMVYGYNKHSTNAVGHVSYRGPIETGIQRILYFQVCSYTLLDRFWDLAKEYNITRWSAHGGTLMGAMCHSSINPWDDDIDITVGSCEKLNEIWDKGGNVTEKYPDLGRGQYFWQSGKKKWDGRLIDDNYILVKGDAGRTGNWFKLKALAQIKSKPTRDLGGMDIQCLDERVSKYETEPMKKSGYRDALVMEEAELQIVEFGPSRIMLVPDLIGQQYVLERYQKESFCDFPLDKTTPPLPISEYSNIGRAMPPWLPMGASRLDEVLSKWYISPNKREEWLSQIDQTSGNELNKQVPNLDHVEIDNSIASTESCRIGDSEQVELNIIGFNAGRGKYWAEFAEMIELLPELNKPDLIIMSEMDIGMARSGNMHTTRKLAFRLGMNYAWGLEFVELTNGNKEEQNMTVGMKNALGLHGNAILSRCPLYNPKIFRDKLDERYFSNKAFKVNAMGTEKRLGGRMGLYVHTGPSPDSMADKSSLVMIGNQTTLSLAPHVIAGSVHKVKEDTFRKEIWEYQGFGQFPKIYKSEKVKQNGVSLYKNNRGVVSSGDLESRGFCTESGLKNLDKPQKHRTFPASCAKQQLGNWRGDYFCGNMKALYDDISILPCYNVQEAEFTNSTSDSKNAVGVQISDHSIIQIRLEMNELD